jgi:hypothetical protein
LNCAIARLRDEIILVFPFSSKLVAAMILKSGAIVEMRLAAPISGLSSADIRFTPNITKLRTQLHGS